MAFDNGQVMGVSKPLKSGNIFGIGAVGLSELFAVREVGHKFHTRRNGRLISPAAKNDSNSNFVFALNGADVFRTRNNWPIAAWNGNPLPAVAHHCLL
jgi:hypothetical protein